MGGLLAAGAFLPWPRVDDKRLTRDGGASPNRSRRWSVFVGDLAHLADWVGVLSLTRLCGLEGEATLHGL